jgi:long-chain acyl-CoA synthetase
MSLNLASIVRSADRYFPQETALIQGRLRLTYRELASHVEAFAAYLTARGVKRGDNVALLLPNRISFTVAYFGVLHVGGTVVPMNFLSVSREIEYVLRDSDAVALVAWNTYAQQATDGFKSVPACRHLILLEEASGLPSVPSGEPLDPAARCDITRTDATDSAVILYTSGTTGEPKGAELTHFNMYSNAQFVAERLLWNKTSFQTLGPGNVTLAALPLFHSFGQTSSQNATILSGGALTYMERFEPQAALEIMQRDGVTAFSGVPTMYFQLLNFAQAAQYDVSSLRYCVSGGAPMPVEVLHAFDARYNVKILEGYGLSETSPVASFNVPYKPRKPGSIGEAIYGVEMKVVDESGHEVPVGEVGEIVIRGYNVMKGYYKRPEATAKAFAHGWFHSGDMATQDTDGYFYIVDRKKDLIIRGGFNVYPREIEELLYSHPAILEAAVVGVGSPEYGQEVKAYVALKTGSEAAKTTEKEIFDFGRKNLAATKYPRIVEILLELPKGPTGKILKKELRTRS